MPDWLVRLREEREQTAERLGKLDRFLGTLKGQHDVGVDEWLDLRYQRELMRALVKVLDRRLRRHGVAYPLAA